MKRFVLFFNMVFCLGLSMNISNTYAKNNETVKTSNSMELKEFKKEKPAKEKPKKEIKEKGCKKTQKQSLDNLISILGGICLGIGVAFVALHGKWNAYRYLKIKDIKKE